MTKVTELGYMGIGVSDAEAWKDYACNVVGMELSEEGEGDRFYLRMDNWHHRIVVHTNGSDDLEYLGWRVPGPREFDAMRAKLEAAGVEHRVCDEAECEERHVLGLMKLADPGGNPTEIFYGPRVDTHRPFHPGRPMYGRFLTGDQGLGHLIAREDDVEAACRFYGEVFGMVGSVEYKLRVPGTDIIAKPIFFHCDLPGARQHSIAFGIPNMPKRINHFMVQYTELNDLGLVYDEVRRRKIDIALAMGVHANDQILTFYMGNPSGWLWELGWGGHPAPAQQEYYVKDVFGHRVEVPGYGLNIEM